MSGSVPNQMIVFLARLRLGCLRRGCKLWLETIQDRYAASLHHGEGEAVLEFAMADMDADLDACVEDAIAWVQRVHEYEEGRAG